MHASSAAAHTALLSTVPENRSSHEASPELVRIEFAEAVDPVTVRLQLLDIDGASVDGVTRLTPDSPASALIEFSLPDLAPGVYGMPWVTVGPDGHRVSGEIVIGVGSFDDGALTGASFGSDPPLDRALAIAAGIGRFLWYLGLSAVIGGLAVAAALRGDRKRREVSDATDAAIRAMWGGAGLIIVALALRWGSALWTLARSLGADGSTDAAAAIGSRTGVTAAIALVLAAALLVSSENVARNLGSRREQLALAVASVLSVALVVANQVNSHAATLGSSVVDAVTSSLHVLGAALWVGPVAVIVFSRVGRDGLALAFRRLAPVFATSAALLAVTGLRALTLTAGTNIGGSFYGVVLLLKIAVVVAVLLPLGLIHDRRYGMLARRGPEEEDSKAAPIQRVRQAQEQRDAHADDRTLRWEGLAFGAVLIAAAVLSSSTPAVFEGRDSTGANPDADVAAALLSDEAPEDLDDCRGRSIGLATCYRDYFAEVMRTQGADVAVAEVAVLEAAGDAHIASDCHQVVHDLGNDAAVYYGDLGKALSYEGAACWSGYYHGVVEYVLSLYEADQLLEEVEGVCESARNDRYSFTHYNCLHGVGHGVMLRLEGDLFTSLPYCEQMTDQWERSSCLSGAFMENIVSAQQAASQRSDGIYANYEPTLDDNNLLFPCSDLEEHLAECYSMQTSWILYRNGRDYANAFELCGQAQPDFIDECYRSMGRDISGDSNLDVERVLSLCALGDGPLQGECIVGASLNAVYHDHDTVKATELCDAVEPQHRAVCEEARDYAASTF